MQLTSTVTRSWAWAYGVGLGTSGAFKWPVVKPTAAHPAASSGDELVDLEGMPCGGNEVGLSTCGIAGLARAVRLGNEADCYP